jgi:hypothetical protein
MVLPHRLPRDHDAGTPKGVGAAPIPVYGWDLIENLKPSNARNLEDKVATGRSLVAPATLAVISGHSTDQ